MLAPRLGLDPQVTYTGVSNETTNQACSGEQVLGDSEDSAGRELNP